MIEKTRIDLSYRKKLILSTSRELIFLFVLLMYSDKTQLSNIACAKGKIHVNGF